MKTTSPRRPRTSFATSRVRSGTRVRSLAGRVFAAGEPVSPALEWRCLGRSYRVGVWPEPVFERSKHEGGWESFVPNPEGEDFAAAAVLLDGARWRAYLEFAPPELSVFMENHRVLRLEAWAVATQCPELLPTLAEAPTLTVFVARHASLRGTPDPRWSEIRAVFERGGRWGLLDWLGLPATREGWQALCDLGMREPGRAELERLRAWLWSVPGARGRCSMQGNALAA